MTASPEHRIDLAAERVGGDVLYATDDFFASKDNLIKPGRGVFIEDKFTENGKWMDGWESRRKRVEGHDWCIIRLGLPGSISEVDIDTNHFLGNHPPHALLEACSVDAATSLDVLKNDDTWTEILPKVPLEPGSQNVYDIADPWSEYRWTHVRLHIYPDGGVARLRVYGDVRPDWTEAGPSEIIDLACVSNGGRAIGCSDMFFSHMQNLLLPDPSMNMGDGWETKRRRGPGHDWVVIQLGHPGQLAELVIDTSHFKGNFPNTCSVEGATMEQSADIDTATWHEVLPETALQAHHQHCFGKDTLATQGPFTHLRLNIFPDGGIARFRVRGIRALDLSADGKTGETEHVAH